MKQCDNYKETKNCNYISSFPRRYLDKYEFIAICLSLDFFLLLKKKKQHTFIQNKYITLACMA